MLMIHDTQGKPINFTKKEKDLCKKRASNILFGWWFQLFFIFTPNLGEMIQFDLRICFKRVGSTTN